MSNKNYQILHRKILYLYASKLGNKFVPPNHSQNKYEFKNN